MSETEEKFVQKSNSNQKQNILCEARDTMVGFDSICVINKNMVLTQDKVFRV